MPELTPSHRIYRGGRCIVELTRDVEVHGGSAKGIHLKGTQLYATRVRSQSRTTLSYAKNDTKWPGQKIRAWDSEFKVVAYEFRWGDCVVEVADRSLRSFSPCVDMTVTHRKLKYGAYVEWRKDLGPRVNFGCRGSRPVAETRQILETIQLACDLAEVEAAYQKEKRAYQKEKR